MQTKRLFNSSLVVALVGLGMAGAPGLRANDWTGTIGWWSDPANWNGGVPDDTAGWAIGNVSNGGTAIVTNSTPHTSEAWAGNNGVAGTIIVTNGGAFNVDNWLVVGRFGGNGNTPLSTLQVTSGGVINKTGNGFLIGDDGNCKGQVMVTGTGQIQVTGGWTSIGLGGTGGSEAWMYLQDNALFNTPAYDFNVGDWGYAHSHCYIKDHATLNASRFWIGKSDNTVGALWQTGGLIFGTGNYANEWTLGGDGSGSPNAFGFYSLAGGTLVCPFNFQVGRYGFGVLYQSGGTNIQSGWCDTGRYPSGEGVTWISGGLFQHNSTGTRYVVGENGRGELTLSGTGVIQIAAAITMGNGTAFLNLNGGVLNVPQIDKWGGNVQSTLSLNGGTIRPTASNPNFISAPLSDIRVYAGNAVFDTAGYSITVSQTLAAPSGQGVSSIPVADGGAGYIAPPIVQISGDGVGALAVAQIDAVAGKVTNIVVTCPGHDFTTISGVNLVGGGATTPATPGVPTLATLASGGVIKNGAGTLTLSGINSYTGTTVVNGGSLVVTAPGEGFGSYVAMDGGAFGVSVQGNGGQFILPSLSLGSSTGGILSFDLGGFGNPPLVPLIVSGTLAVNGTASVTIADALPQVGEFPLMQFGSRAGSGQFVLGAIPAGVQAHLTTNLTSGTLDLVITSVGIPRWDGRAGGTWDINVTTNWTDLVTGLPTFYKDGAAVLFDDTALGTTVVNLVANVVPGTLEVTNSALNYTLTGTGKIGGTVGLTKLGTGTLTIGNAPNAFTGPALLGGGTVVVTNLADGGQPSAIGAASSNPTNLVLGGGTLSYAGPPQTINRGYSLQFNYGNNGAVINNTLDLQGNLTLKGAATAALGSSFIKSGPGTLTYAGSVTNELAGGNYPGYQVLAGAVVFDGSSSGQLNHCLSEFWIGDSTASGAALVLTNTILNVESWVALGRGNGDSGLLSTVSLYNSTLTCGSLSLGYWANRPNLATQILTLNNSTLMDRGAFNLSESGGSTATISLNGASVLSDYGPFLFGLASGSTGSLFMADSAIITNSLWASIGANGVGNLGMKNSALLAEGSDFNLGDYGAVGSTGNLTIQDNAQLIMTGNGNGFFVGKSYQAIGTVTQSGGLINARSAGVFQLAQQSGTMGTWLQSGGTNYAGGWVSIGRGANSGDTSPTGLLVVSGGLFDQTSAGNGLIVGEQGTGTLTITNTGVVISEATSAGIGVAIGWNQGIGTLNLDGGTLVANYIQGGSGASAFNFNGGLLRVGASARLNFMANLSSAMVLAGAVVDTGTNLIAIGQALLDGGKGGGLTKNGNGVLLLDGVSTYLGTTTVSAGTLGGNGTLAGPVVVSAGAALAPGDSAIGILTVGNSLTLAPGSTTVMELSKTGQTNDQVVGITTLTYGGNLVLKNLAGKLAAGDTFKLFEAASYHGSFTNVVTQSLGQTVTWDTSRLAVDGTIKVASAVVLRVAITPVVGPSGLTLSWPVSQTGWLLQVQTNALAVGLSTNWVAVPGSTNSNQAIFPIDHASPTVFFRLLLP